MMQPHHSAVDGPPVQSHHVRVGHRAGAGIPLPPGAEWEDTQCV
jgi:hypothetical protein